MAITNQMLNEQKEPDCFAVTPERKYYRVGNTFIKRSLRPREWQTSPVSGNVHIPRLGRERLMNEAAAMSFIRDHTSIPIPAIHCTFEDDGAIYIIMEYVEGVGMDELDDKQRENIKLELDDHLRAMRSLRSRFTGGPSGLVIPPYRLTLKTLTDVWDLRASDKEDLVFCHNDLSQQNVIVDPVSLKINAIVDWEYAGFYPDYFECRFFERLGPSVALDDEEDDSERLLSFLDSLSVCSVGNFSLLGLLEANPDISDFQAQRTDHDHANS